MTKRPTRLQKLRQDLHKADSPDSAAVIVEAIKEEERKRLEAPERKRRLANERQKRFRERHSAEAFAQAQGDQTQSKDAYNQVKEIQRIIQKQLDIWDKGGRRGLTYLDAIGAIFSSRSERNLKLRKILLRMMEID